MTDYIKREAALNFRLKVELRPNELTAAQAVADAIIEYIKAIPAADAIEELSKPRWIPVTERLPEDGIFVLVCNDDGHTMVAKHETETCDWYYKYTNYDFDIWDNEEQGPVCYWQPLPEPPLVNIPLVINNAPTVIPAEEGE